MIISVENVSKSYLVGHRAPHRERYTALRDVIVRETRNFVRKSIDVIRGRQIVQGDEVEEFWALKDVSFKVEQGDVLGIIGRNGAGKSTLLKILSRITEPTKGRVTLRGPVASLLEVGTGFHNELTGRENIFLNGAILGMSKREIREKFDKIVAFAEVERFLDTPVKRYSSGMYVRLAFAVAAHLEPEILIIDEVLAVGDAEFQKKCLRKMDEVSHREGRTVLFVSHNMGALAALCRSAIWLDNGSVRMQGSARQVVAAYLTQELPNKNAFVDFDSMVNPHCEDDRIHLKSLEWQCDLPLKHGELARGRIHFQAHRPLQDLTVGIGFSNLEGTRLLTYESDFQDGVRPSITQTGPCYVDFEFPSLPLAPDVYNVDIGCRSGDFHALAYIPAAFQMEIVAGSRTPGYIVRKGAGIRLKSRWTWEHRE
jgi:lipopolysaccharide transport system ATP-binding protein